MANPTGILFSDPRVKPLSSTGVYQPGCYACFFTTGTTTPTNVYADGGLTVVLSQPAAGSVNPSGGTVAGSDGRFVPMYMDPGVTYRVQVYNAAGQLLEDTDPYVVPAPGLNANAATLNGVPAANYARVSRTATEITNNTVVRNQFAGVTNASAYVTATDGPTITLDWSLGNTQAVTLGGNRTMALPINAVDGEAIDLAVIQDATGGRTLAWNAAFLFPGGGAPSLSPQAGGVDRFQIIYNAALGKYLVTPSTFLGASSSVTATTVTQSGVYFNLVAAMGGSITGTPTINITVNPGVILQSLNPALPAMDLTGVPAGSTVNLINNGYIIGCGGKGADGSSASYPGSGTCIANAGNAQPGGPAILGPGTGVAFNITNGSGHIWGGGGGAGAGGTYDGVSGEGSASSGGGGGGAGGGPGGRGGGAAYILLGVTPNATDGSYGTLGPNGAPGAAGTGVTEGSGAVGASAVGGAYGAAGANGAAAGTAATGHNGAPSNGAAGGYAISLQGGPVPTFVSGGTSPNVKGSVA